MKNIYLYMFVCLIAIIMLVIGLLNFDPKVETWSSMIAGAAVALLILKSPPIRVYLKQKKAK